ncbi:MAG: glycosyltransferase, partial [Ignavibacteriaceae bacterium]|nr:glycosyltransferase [Ignavibacteriaceae bacterium]
PKDFEDLKVDTKPNNKLQITYSGIFYEYITPKYFLRAFKKLLEERPDVAADIQLNFVGILRNENKKLIGKLNLHQYVKEYGYLNHRDALSKCMQSDILWMMVGYGRNADTISSGKLYEYFGTKKPILACLPTGALKNAVTEYGASFVTSPNNIDEIKNALLQVYELYKQDALPVPDDEFVQKHRRDFLTEQLSKQFVQCVKDVL